MTDPDLPAPHAPHAPHAPPAPPVRRSGLALFAFCLAIPGFLVLPFALAAAALGFVALRRLRRRRAVGGRGLALVAVASLPVSLVVTLAFGLAAYRSFVEFTRRARASDAVLHLHTVMEGLDRHVSDRGSLPAGIAATPSEPPCGGVRWPDDASPAWHALGFAPESPVFFAYELVTEPDGRRFTVRAIGDLDCDGERSVRELRGRYDGAELKFEMRVTDELE